MGFPDRPDENTVFEIGSVTKTFTGLLLATLVRQNRVQLTDTVSRFVHELEGTPAGRITLRELTTHTSGLPKLPENLHYGDINRPYADYTEADLLEGLRTYALPNALADTVVYSNWGAALLGYALARSQNTTCPEIIRNEVTEPLAMHDTTIALSEDQSSRLAQGYDEHLHEVPLWDRQILFGNGALRTTAFDLMKYLAAEMNPEISPLRDAILLSQELQADDGTYRIAFNWYFDTGNSSVLSHNGQTGGFTSDFVFHRENREGYFYLTNTLRMLTCVREAVFGGTCSPE